MKTDAPGCLDVKLAIIAKDPAGWLDALAEVGTLDEEREDTGWQIRCMRTGAKLQGLEIRVLGFVGADRIVSDGTTEIPDVSIADVPRMAGPPSKDTLMAALKDALREAAKNTPPPEP
jgi:hypothetical protein